MTRVRGVAVIGAGPAGSLVAREMARRGADVLLLDRVEFPRWKVCGSCMSPGSASILESVGLGHVLQRLGAVPLTALRLSAGRVRATLGLSRQVAVSREALDHALIQEAVDAGVQFMPGSRVRLGDLASGHQCLHLDQVGGRSEIRARVVVDAAGLVGATAGSDADRSVVRPGSRVGLGAVFKEGPSEYEPGAIHMVMGRYGYVGLVRVEDGRLNVAAAFDPAAVSAAGSPAGAVAEVLSEAGLPSLPESPLLGWRGTPALTRAPGAVVSERLFRVGDAAGYVEPFTGEGMAWAFSGACALAPIATDAAREWTPAHALAWSQAHGQGSHRGQAVCRAVAWGLRQPRLSRVTVRILAHAPGLARPVVRLVESPPRFALEAAPWA